jgi:hypothetical protein
MSVFDATTKVKRAVSDPLSDHKLPHPKSLSWGAITSPSAVAGTNGAHCDLVHGDQWHEIKGNHNQNIQQNQTIKVVGKHKETLADSCYQNIIGPHTVLNNNVRNETRLGVFTKTYGDNTKQEDQSGDITSQSSNTSKAQWKVAMVGANCSLNGINFNGSAINANIWPIHVDLKGGHYLELVQKNEKMYAKNTIAALITKYIGTATNNNGIETNNNGIETNNHAIETTAGVQLNELADLLDPFAGLLNAMTTL